MQRMLFGAALASLMCAVCACGGVPPNDAAVADAAVDAADASIDAVDASPPDAGTALTRIELVGGAAPLTGGAYTVELTIAPASDPTPVTAPGLRVESGTPANP